MAPQIWLLRHGEAVPHDSKPDQERELTARGERQALAAGAALARLGAEFGACYTSPKVRARQTAALDPQLRHRQHAALAEAAQPQHDHLQLAAAVERIRVDDLPECRTGDVGDLEPEEVHPQGSHGE